MKEGGTVRRTEGPCERSKEGREEGRKDYVSRKEGLYFKDGGKEGKKDGGKEGRRGRQEM